MSTTTGTPNRPVANTAEILSAWNREILSANAVKLYEAVWHRMRIKKVAQVWMDDVEASMRSRTQIQFIPAARAELVNTGLLECRQGSREWSYIYIGQSEYDAE